MATSGVCGLCLQRLPRFFVAPKKGVVGTGRWNRKVRTSCLPFAAFEFADELEASANKMGPFYCLLSPASLHLTAASPSGRAIICEGT